MWTDPGRFIHQLEVCFVSLASRPPITLYFCLFLFVLFYFIENNAFAKLNKPPLSNKLPSNVFGINKPLPWGGGGGGLIGDLQ